MRKTQLTIMPHVNAIVYCRISKADTSSNNRFNKSVSLESQETANKDYATNSDMRVCSVVKHVGGAFEKPQTELLALLNTTKNKVVVVHEASRLTRSTENFPKIVRICIRNKIDICVVSTNKTYCLSNASDLEELTGLVNIANKESKLLSQRMLRIHAYKKKNQLPYGFTKDANGYTIPSQPEAGTLSLIRLLKTPGSSVRAISDMIDILKTRNTHVKFELVEFVGDKQFLLSADRLPYEMCPKQIYDTLRLYGIYKRRNLWKLNDIRAIDAGASSADSVALDDIDEVDDLAIDPDYDPEATEDDEDDGGDEDEDVLTPRTPPTPTPRTPPPTPRAPTTEWITIWYDPEIGLPPNIRIPVGMTLPNTPGTIMFPKQSI